MPPPDGPSPDAPPDAPPDSAGVGTLAGGSSAGAVDGTRDVARFSNPVNVLAAPGGLVYVADFDNDRIRTVDRAGTVSTLIRQNGFQRPFGLALAASGTLYVGTDNDASGGHSSTSGTVWRFDPGASQAVVVAGNFGRPRGLAVLADGRVAVVDHSRHVVQLLDPSSGLAVRLAGAVDAPGYVDGAAAAARFSGPYSVAQRADGKLLVTDYGNHRIRVLDPATGATTTFAGNGMSGYADGELAAAAFSQPQGIAIGASGDIFITDTGNFRIRRIRGATVSTLAGDGTGGHRDAAELLAAQFYGLEGISVSRDGVTLLVADGNHGEGQAYHRVRYVKLTP